MQESLEPTVSNPQNLSKGPVWRLQAVFFEPAALWKDIDLKPGFVLALILCVIISIAGTAAIYSKVDLRDIMEDGIRSSSAGERLTAEQIREQVDQIVNSPVYGVIKWAGPVLSVPVMVLLVSGLMLLLVYLGGSISTFSRLLSVSTHSFFLYQIVYTGLVVIVYFVSSDPKAIDIQNPLMSNLGFLLNPKESPILYRLIQSFDLITFYVIYLLGSGMAGVSPKMKSSTGVLLIGFLYAIYVGLVMLWRALFG